MTEPIQPSFYAPWPLFGKKTSNQWHESRSNSEVMAVLAQAAGFAMDPDHLKDSDLASWELGELDFHNRFRLVYDDTGTALKIQKNDGTEDVPIWTDALTVDYETGNVTFTGSGSSSITVKTTVPLPTFSTDTLLFDRDDFYISPSSTGKPIVSLAAEAGSGGTPGISSITVNTTVPPQTFATDTITFDKDDFYLSPSSTGKPIVSLNAEAIAALSSITVKTTVPLPTFSTGTLIFDRSDFYISPNSAGLPVVSIAAEDVDTDTTSLTVKTTEASPTFATDTLIFDRSNFYISPNSAGKPIVSWTPNTPSTGDPTVVSGVQSQAFPSSVEWVFNHGLNSRPLIWSTYGTGFEAVLPDRLDISNPNTAYFYFVEAFAGTAIVSSGRTSVDLTGGFYGMSIRNNPRTESFKNINLLSFDATDFYLTQNNPNRDEVLISLKESLTKFVHKTGDSMTGNLTMSNGQFRGGTESNVGGGLMPQYAFNRTDFTYGHISGIGYREPFGIPFLELMAYGQIFLTMIPAFVPNTPHLSLNTLDTVGAGIVDCRYIGLKLLTGAQILALTPLEGMVVYNTDTNVLNFYNGAAWAAV